MAPCKFADLGKNAKDLLTKDYGIGETKVRIKNTEISSWFRTGMLTVLYPFQIVS